MVARLQTIKRKIRNKQKLGFSERARAVNKGGRPGQWSARKAQMLAKRYKAAGGGYRG